MGYPLSDITFYYDGNILKIAPEDWTFTKMMNYVSDLYHIKLEGYKPPKTSRICIHLNSQLHKPEPTFFGSICSCYTSIDEQRYMKLDHSDKLLYLLSIVHETVMNAGRKLGWDLSVFTKANQEILESQLKFENGYPWKQSANRKLKLRSVVRKNLERSFVYFEVSSGDCPTSEFMVLEKRNWFWFDSCYQIAKNSKWIDKTHFGYKNSKSGKFAILDTSKLSLSTNIEYEDKEF